MQWVTCSESYYEEFKWQWGVLEGSNALHRDTIREVTAIDQVQGTGLYVGWRWWEWKKEGDQQFVFCCRIDKILYVHICQSGRVWRRQMKLGNRNQDENDLIDRDLSDRGKDSHVRTSTLSLLWFAFLHLIDCWFHPLSESKCIKIQIKQEAQYIQYY